jgi:biopolymer transport protein TolQ
MIALLQVAGRPPAGLSEMILHGNPSTQVILLVTALFSLASWVIIFWKIAQLRRLRRQGDRFLGAIERTQRLEDVYRSVLRLPESPYVAVFRQGMNFFSELRPGALRENAAPTAGLSEAQLQALRLMMEKEQEERVEDLSGGLAWLAVIGGVSPLLGLLGTVIGVMHAFVGIGESGTGSISAVAPGIAEALITTVAGLVVAIPALMAYNLFVRRVNTFDGELEGFASEFIGALAREGRL